MNKIGLISEIKVNGSETWMNRILLTFDIDWASDFILKDTLEILIEHGASATFFTTHNTQINTIISSSEDFDLGILNVHGGDLPRCRGNACQTWTILNSEDKIGLCVHKMVGGELDNGDILVRDYISIFKDTKINQVLE